MDYLRKLSEMGPKHIAITSLMTGESEMSVAVFDAKNNKFYKIGETTAWNFQQGAMLQYHPFKEDTVYYNVCENGEFKIERYSYDAHLGTLRVENDMHLQ